MNTVMPRPDDRTPPAGTAGFSLVELSVALVAATLLLLVLYGTVHAAYQSRITADRKYQITRLAGDYFERLRQLPFGEPTAPAATSAQLDELFDDDENLGTVTLLQLRVAPTDPGYSFQMAVHGRLVTWRIKVTSDLDGDHSLLGAREGRDDLVRMEIWADERLVLESMRSDEAGT